MNTTKKCTLALAILSASLGQAYASDAEGEYHGYFRAGAGTNSSKGSQACFGLEGVAKYRLGNECDFYGEFLYTKELAKAANGASFVGTIMANTFSPSSDIGDNKLGLNQMFVEAKNIDFLKGGTAWIGKRFYNRPDIHVLDMQMVGMDGVGAGVDAIPMGPGKFSYALFRSDLNNKDSSATRHNFLYHGLPVNTNGALKFDFTIVSADSKVANAHGGWSASVAHVQDKLLGGNNTLWLQYGQGAAAGKPGTTGNILAGSDVTFSRIGDQLIWQATPEFSGSADFVVQRDATSAGTRTWTSIGTRPVYALHENFKLQLDIGHDRISPAGGGATQQLTKITFAPTISAGKGFWSRPELRTYVTYAKWNTAAQQAASAGSTLSSTGVFGGSTNGTSVGVQVETWF